MRSLKRIIWETVFAQIRHRKGPSRPLDTFNADQIRRILVVSCTAMGDTFLSTPAIAATRKLFPRATIIWLLRDRFLPLFSTNPHVDGFMVYRGRYRGLLRMFKRFRQERFDLMLSFHDSDLGPVGTAYLAGIPFILRSGLRDMPALPYLSARVPYREDVHQIEQRLDVLRTLVHPDDVHFDTRMVATIPPESVIRVGQKIQRLGVNLQKDWLIGIQASTSRPYTQWPAENIVRITRLLLEKNPRIKVCFLGAPGEKAKLTKLVKAIGRNDRILVLAQTIHLSELPAVMKLLAVFVSPDTGPMHLAFAAGTPTVCLFVPTDIHHIGPYQDAERHVLIQKERPCEPCRRKYCATPHCMARIGVDEVFEGICAQLLKYSRWNG